MGHKITAKKRKKKRIAKHKRKADKFLDELHQGLHSVLPINI